MVQQRDLPDKAQSRQTSPFSLPSVNSDEAWRERERRRVTTPLQVVCATRTCSCVRTNTHTRTHTHTRVSRTLAKHTQTHTTRARTPRAPQSLLARILTSHIIPRTRGCMRGSSWLASKKIRRFLGSGTKHQRGHAPNLTRSIAPERPAARTPR